MLERTLIITEQHLLECRLTDEERRSKADQAAETSARAAEARRSEEGYRELAKEAKGRAELGEQEAGRLLAIYRRGAEDRQVPVQVLYDDGDKLVHEVRTDTGEVLRRRSPTAAELLAVQQLTLDVDDVSRRRRRGGKAEA